MQITIDVPHLTPTRLMSRSDVIQYLRFEVLLVNALAAGWIAPLGKTGNHKNGNELYSRKDVEAVEARILSGEMPPPARIKKITESTKK